MSRSTRRCGSRAWRMLPWHPGTAMVGYQRGRIRTMTIHLPEGREQFIRSLVADGRFASESDVVDEALGLLEQQERRRAGLRESAESPAESAPTRRPIWEVIQEISATVPDEVW